MAPRAPRLYVPVGAIWGHLTIVFYVGRMMAGCGYEWWSTPIVISAKRGLLCVWRLGTRWKRVRYSEIREIGSFRGIGGARLGIRLRDGTDISLGAGRAYSGRELRKTLEAILHNVRAIEGEDAWERREAGSAGTVWRRKQA